MYIDKEYNFLSAYDRDDSARTRAEDTNPIVYWRDRKRCFICRHTEHKTYIDGIGIG